MLRSTMALVAVVILAGFTPAQQVTTHTVVKGDCLWDLAQTYYGNPFQWRRIWNANRSRVSDPNYILPGWVLTIPPKEATVGQVTVQPAGAAPEASQPATPKAPVPLPSISPAAAAHQPTVFRETAPGRNERMRSEASMYTAVSRNEMYGAPWLVRAGRETAVVGTLEGIAGPHRKAADPHRFDEVRVVFQGAPPPVGTSLRLFRMTKTIPQVGRVATPSGVIRITTVSGDSAVALVTEAYARIQVGDLVDALPEYSLERGEHAQRVSQGPVAMIVGFAGTSVIPADDQVAFLDQGRDDGVAVGDEYELVNPALGSHPVEGRLQVVSVTAHGASARIVQVSGAVFRQGVAVRLSRKMR